jgi:Tetratricopeptide repeat
LQNDKKKKKKKEEKKNEKKRKEEEMNNRQHRTRRKVELMCGTCGEQSAQLKCVSCHERNVNVFYCSNRCQQQAWRLHGKCCGLKLDNTWRDRGRRLFADGEWTLALKCFTNLVHQRRARFGTCHPFYATALNDVAASHFMTGDMLAAQALFRQVVDIRAKALGAKHPDTLRSIRCLKSSSSLN